MTRLIWKKRTSKKRRAYWIDVFKHIFPDASDDGVGMICACETGRTLWVLAFCRDFSGAEYGVEPVAK